jgi:hypothetical protein
VEDGEPSYTDTEPPDYGDEPSFEDSRVVEPPDAVADPFKAVGTKVDGSKGDTEFTHLDKLGQTLEETDLRDFKWFDRSTWRDRSGTGLTGEFTDPLLGGVELTEFKGPKMFDPDGPKPFADPDATAGGAAHGLRHSERPSPAEAGVELGDVRAGLNEVIGRGRGAGLSNSAMAAEMGVGLSEGGGLWITRTTLKGYLMKQGKGLIAAPILAPLMLLLNQAQDGLGDMVSLGMVTMDLLATGDPLGLLIYGVAQLWDAANESRQKVIDNDTPDKDYGTRMGYVREGDTWYPMIYARKHKSTGLWAGDGEMTLDYGHDIVWQMDGSGKFQPAIPNSTSKAFIYNEDEWDFDKTVDSLEGGSGDPIRINGKRYIDGAEAAMSGKMLDNSSFQKLGDTTRDWYFLTPEEMKKVVTGETVLKSYTDDVTKYNPAARLVNDWRKALDSGQNHKWSSTVKASGKGAAVNDYEGSRGLQRIMYENALGSGGVDMTATTDYTEYIKNIAGKDEEFQSDKTLSPYLFDTVLKDHIKALYQTQKTAAEEAGFHELYGGTFKDEKDTKPGGTVWSAMYLDTAKDMPVASSADALQAQLDAIEMLNDRTPAQRNYLAQKVQTRYWMQQAVTIGDSDKLMEFLVGRNFTQGDPYGMKKYTATATSQFTGDLRTSDLHLDAVPGFVMPWQNAGEGYLPMLTGALEWKSKASDYMADFERTAYDRLTEEARVNAAAWVKATGKLDPNYKLEGIDRTMSDDWWVEKPDLTEAKTVTFADDTKGETDKGETDKEEKPSGDLTDGEKWLKTMKGIDDAAAAKAAAEAEDKIRLLADMTPAERAAYEKMLAERHAEAGAKDSFDDRRDTKFDKHEDELDVAAWKKAKRDNNWAEMTRLEQMALARKWEFLNKKRREFDASAWRRKELAAEKYKKLHEGVEGEGKSTKHGVAVEKWRQMGIDLGMIDEKAPPKAPKAPKSPVRPTAVNSHGATIVPVHHTAVSVPMSHTVDHEEFTFPSMSSTFLAAIHAAEAPAPAAPLPAAIKVI